MPVLARGAAALFDNLYQGLRLIFFRRVDAGRVRPGVDAATALVVLGLAVSTAIGWVWYGSDGSFDAAALPDNLFFLPVLLLAASWVERLLGRPGFAATFTVLVLAGALWLDLLEFALGFSQRSNATVQRPVLYGGLYYLLWAWWLGAMLVFVLRQRAAGMRRALAGFGLYAASFLATNLLLPPTDLWAPAQKAADNANEPVMTEEILHLQPDVFAQAMDDLEPQRPDVDDLYFVGVAGYAEEDVFMRELDVIARLFEERFDTAGRSVLLVNNPRTATTLPLATATNLSQALAHLGEVMDTEQDVLVLYITTHGSQTHDLALTYGALELDDITPESLRAMLDRSRIRWRVVIVSACYSGAYIDALRDDRTLVMTASDATHTSFGCGTESDFTYFGRALFDEALRKTHSFERAFAAARVSIAQREKREGEESSNPQIWVGSAIRAKLARIERRLDQSTHDRIDTAVPPWLRTNLPALAGARS
jgi:Peptidase C13 family